MSVIATAVRHLMAAGVTGEALLSAIADMEAEIRAEPKPRSTAAVRQERYRRNKASQTVTNDAPLPLPPNENISNPPTPTPGYNTPARKAGKTIIAKPDGVTAETWRDFTDHRKRKGGITQTALAGIEREAKAAGWPMEAALAEVVTRNWQGFKADWVKDIQKPNGQGSQTDPLMAGFLARQARNAEFADP